jgi:hypothetical protein
LLCLAACRVQQPLQEIKAPDINSEDSTEYEIVVFDPGFETWYLSQRSPAMDRSIDFYRSRNREYVRAWNMKTMIPRYSRLLGAPIDYDPSEPYPLEIEHKLYYYFQYVEKKLKIRIL